MTSATVIIAAHNEEQVIGRTLDALTEAVAGGEIRIVVVCNGCTDGTAAIARGYRGVSVIDLDVASKAAALRAGDRHALAGARIYLDADIVLTSRAARDVAAALEAGALAARPPHRFDSMKARSPVRAWYRVRESLPSISSALWGAGCYALSAQARSQFDEFPDITSDDLFVDSLFGPAEVRIVPTDPLVVTTPRRVRDLLRILRRSYRTQSEVADAAPGLSQGQRGQLADLRDLLRRQPTRLLDVIVYVSLIGLARLQARFSRERSGWERDLSSRGLA